MRHAWSIIAVVHLWALWTLVPEPPPSGEALALAASDLTVLPEPLPPPLWLPGFWVEGQEVAQRPHVSWRAHALPLTDAEARAGKARQGSPRRAAYED